MKQVNPESLSEIEVSYWLTHSSIKDYYDILTVRYKGKYGDGSRGNPDAQYMFAKGVYGVVAFEPMAVIIDFTELEYEWGDMLEMVFDITSRGYGGNDYPQALVLGSRCSEAIGTLIHGINSKEPATTEDWIFDSFEEAKRYIEHELEKNESNQSCHTTPASAPR